MITETKKIRTKKGDPMMFATLDDLDASVELLVFGNALATAGDVLAADSIVLVRGRVDHKDRDKTCIVAQQIEPFRPSAEEVSEAQEQEARRSATRAPCACGSTRPRWPPPCSGSSRTCSPASRATARW